MPTAKKLPSGNYRARAQKTINGTFIRKSFTAESKSEAEYMATKWQFEIKEEAKPTNMTFDKACDVFIKNYDNILSPSTIRGYRTMQRNCFDEIKNIKLKDLTSSKVQGMINRNASKYSQHSLKNQFGFISRVCKEYNLSFNVKLPPKEKLKYNIPDISDITTILDIVKGTRIEGQILFALMLGLRQSEIAALKWENLVGNKITIRGAIVPDEHHQWVEKKTNKSYASTRTLEVPDYLMQFLNKIKKENGYIFSTNPDNVSKIWRRLTNDNGLPPFKIHELRHANASMLLMLGMPDLYIMERLGHSSPNMVKTVYEHTYTDIHESYNKKINEFYNKLP